MTRRTPGAVLLARFALEAELSTVPSRTGEQCQALAEQRTPDGTGRTGKLIEYGDLILLTKDLTPEDLHLCRLRYGLQPQASRLAVEQCRAAGVQPPTVELQSRIVTAGELEDAEHFDGDTLIPGKMGTIHGNSNLRKVEGYRCRLPSYEEIAAELSSTQPGAEATSPRQVKRIISGALSKVAVAIKWRTFQEAIEERYE